MPQDLSDLSTGSFIMFILINILMACTFSLRQSVWGVVAFGSFYMVNVIQTYQFAYYGNILTSLISLQLHIDFALCLYFVLKDFTRNELKLEFFRQRTDEEPSFIMNVDESEHE